MHSRVVTCTVFTHVQSRINCCDTIYSIYTCSQPALLINNSLTSPSIQEGLVRVKLMKLSLPV